MSTSQRLGSSLLIVLSLVLMAFSPVGAPAAPGADVGQVNSHLKRAEANLALVDGSIGHLTRPPKGSAAKLAKMRLEQALGDIEAAGKLLRGLSGGDGVPEATKRYNTAVTLYGKLRGILTGEAPKPKPEPTPEPEPDVEETDEPREEAPKTVRLGYPHADNFKNSLFTLRRVEGDTAALVELLEELRPVADQLAIDHRTTARAMASIAETRRQAGFVRTGLDRIPSNGEGVAEAEQRLVNARASLDVAATYFEPLNARLADLVNPANYPELDRDVKRLRELSRAYGNLEYLFREQRASAAETLGQLEAARAECTRVSETYARLIQQATDHGKHVEVACNNFLRGQQAFLEAAARQKESLPADIRKDLAEADQYAREAVQEQKPLWFTGGIPQRMEWAADKLGLYRVLDPQGGEALQREFDAMEASLLERADSLKELIIRENPLPADRYTGADRDATIAMAVDAWKHQEPDFELLTSRIPSETWSRDTRWTYSNGTWYFSDRSTLQVRLIVADRNNPELAIDRPINVRMDHQKGDSLIGVPMRSFDESLEPSEYLLRSRIE